MSNLNKALYVLLCGVAISAYLCYKWGVDMVVRESQDAVICLAATSICALAILWLKSFLKEALAEINTDTLDNECITPQPKEVQNEYQ